MLPSFRGRFNSTSYKSCGGFNNNHAENTGSVSVKEYNGGVARSHAEKTGSVSGPQLVMYHASFVKIETLGGVANHAVNTGSVSDPGGSIGHAANHASNIGSVSGLIYTASFSHVYLFRTYCMYLWSANSI